VIVRSTRSCVALVLILTAVTLAGCRSGSHSGNPSPIGTTSSSPSPAPSAVAADAAIAAYRGMWKAVVAASAVPDPDAPDLRRYASGDALKLIVGKLVVDRDQGKVAKGDVVLNPTVTALQPPDKPTQATITDCVDDTNWLEYKKSGELWNNEPGGKHHNTATVTLIDGVWKVSSFTLEVKGTC
jgi:hypothetical protein